MLIRLLNAYRLQEDPLLKAFSLQLWFYEEKQDPQIAKTLLTPVPAPIPVGHRALFRHFFAS